MKSPIRKGGVYWVLDSSIQLPPESVRTVKRRRPVIVISGDATNEAAAWPIALVIPVSTSPAFATDFCLKIGKGVANLPEPGWARVVAIQPLAKGEIGDYVGHLPSAMMAILVENLLSYADLIP